MGRGRSGRRGGGKSGARRDYDRWLATQRAINEDSGSGGTMDATSFRDVPQRNDPSVTNTYFNTPGDGSAHGHVKYRENPDGTTDYLYARDVEGNEYEV